MALGFTCNSATNGNCTQISWLVNVLTKIQSSLHFSLHSRLRAFPVMCLPGFIPIWETEFSRVRMFPDKHIPEFIHSPIRAGIGATSTYGYMAQLSNGVYQLGVSVNVVSVSNLKGSGTCSI